MIEDGNANSDTTKRANSGHDHDEQPRPAMTAAPTAPTTSAPTTSAPISVASPTAATSTNEPPTAASAPITVAAPTASTSTSEPPTAASAPITVAAPTAANEPPTAAPAGRDPSFVEDEPEDEVPEYDELEDEVYDETQDYSDFYDDETQDYTDSSLAFESVEDTLSMSYTRDSLRQNYYYFNGGSQCFSRFYGPMSQGY